MHFNGQFDLPSIWATNEWIRCWAGEGWYLLGFVIKWFELTRSACYSIERRPPMTPDRRSLPYSQQITVTTYVKRATM